MNEYDELLDGSGVDPNDEAALRQALHDQLCMDAALTAHFSTGPAEHLIRRSVLAVLQSGSEAELRRRVMQDVRRKPRANVQRRWTTELALVAAAMILFMAVGWWILRAPTTTQTVSRPIPSETTESPTPIVTPTVKHTEKPIVQTTAPTPQVEAPKDVTPKPLPAPQPSSVAIVPAPPPPMKPATVEVVTTTPLVVAKPAADMKATLGTPPPAILSPQPMTKKSSERNPAQWPFSAVSPWNSPIGSEARLEPITPDEFAEQTIGFQPRTIYQATAQHPLVRIKRARGPALKLAFANSWANTPGTRAAPTTVIEPDGRWAVEYHGLRYDDGEWNVGDITRFSLLEDGVGRDGHGIGDSGLPAMAGVIRSGEWEGGIHHVISIIVPASLLNAKAGGGKAWTWPAQPDQAPDTSGFAKRGNLHLGSLLALPLAAHPAKLGLTEGTTQYRLALALWEHGACIVGSSKEGRVGISLLTETLASGTMDHDTTKRIFSLLQVVANHSSSRPGGGGTPRCALASPFSLAK